MRLDCNLLVLLNNLFVMDRCDATRVVPALRAASCLLASLYCGYFLSLVLFVIERCWTARVVANAWCFFLFV